MVEKPITVYWNVSQVQVARKENEVIAPGIGV